MLVGFVCTTIFHYLHFKRIAEQFGDQAIYIIVTPRLTNGRYERLEAYFQDRAVNYCSADEVIVGKVALGAVIAPYYSSLYSFISPDIPRIRVMYGYAKDAWNYADWNRGFDLILTYGPYAQRALSVKAPSVPIGHPRHSLNNTPATDITSVTGQRLSGWLSSSGRETLLYCPTWGDLSSFRWFKQAVGMLTERYKIIIKLHHLTALTGDYELEIIEHQHLFVCDETVDLFDLFSISDAVISDYSGAIFDAMLANKRIVLVNALEETVRDTGILNIKKMSNVADLNDKNINIDGSLDIQARAILPNVGDPSQLAETVADVLANPVIDYHKMNQDLYAEMDDQAPQRAHAAICTLLDDPRELTRTSDIGISFRKDEFIAFVKRHSKRRFIIWGAGDYGQLMISWLISRGYQLVAILDASTDKQGRQLFNVPIYSPDTYRFESQDCLVMSFDYKPREALNDHLVARGLFDESSVLIPF